MAALLVVEDDDSVRAFVRRALERAGHTVHEAEDGAEALEMLRGEAGEVDLVLSDIQMPVMDGIALALNLARERPDLPIMLMTGYAHQRERAHGLEEIVLDVVEKPFTLAEITARVNAALEQLAARG
ncbi:response regulator [Lutibaculum baratangense]|nr:response regulator [Lutibaculum baratangense]